MSYVSSIELRKVRPEVVKYELETFFLSQIKSSVSFFSEKGVLESVVNLFHDVVDKVPQVNFSSFPGFNFCSID